MELSGWRETISTLGKSFPARSRKDVSVRPHCIIVPCKPHLPTRRPAGPVAAWNFSREALGWEDGRPRPSYQGMASAVRDRRRTAALAAVPPQEVAVTGTHDRPFAGEGARATQATESAYPRLSAPHLVGSPPLRLRGHLARVAIAAHPARRVRIRESCSSPCG